MRLYSLGKPISRPEFAQVLKVRKPTWAAGTGSDNSWTYLFSGSRKRGGICDCARGSSEWIFIDESDCQAFVRAGFRPRK